MWKNWAAGHPLETTINLAKIGVNKVDYCASLTTSTLRCDANPKTADESAVSVFMRKCFYRATACNATHGIAVAILSVRPSLRCVYCDNTK